MPAPAGLVLLTLCLSLFHTSLDKQDLILSECSEQMEQKIISEISISLCVSIYICVCTSAFCHVSNSISLVRALIMCGSLFSENSLL